MGAGMFSSRLLTGGTAQRVGLMEGSLRFWDPRCLSPDPTSLPILLPICLPMSPAKCF